jgi:hypothetical protein
MSLTLTPLPSRVSAKSLLPNTDPATGVVTATGRPTRHAWAVGQTVLAAMGVRLDLTGAGRRHGEDLELLTAWLTAHNVQVLVIRHATNIANLEVLDDLLHVTTTTGTDLALTCDDTVGHHLIDWVTERSGTIDTTHQPLLRRLNEVRRDATVNETDTGMGTEGPVLLPRVDFYKFRARCRDLLTPTEFAAVDARYVHVFRQVQANPFASVTEASTRLTEAIEGSDHPGYALTTIRAAQAAMFTYGLLLKVNLDYFLNGVRDREHRRLTPTEVHALRAYRTPWRSAAVLLRDADLTRDQITSLTLGNVTVDGDLTGVNHAPLLPQARLYLRAQRLFRTIHGATDADPFITEAARYVAQAQRRASADLNLPRTPTHEAADSRRCDRWQTNLGVSLLPLTGLHLPDPETIKTGTPR